MPGAPDQRVTMEAGSIILVYPQSITHQNQHTIFPLRIDQSLTLERNIPSTLPTYLQQACSFIYTSTILSMFHSRVIKDIICKSPRLVCHALPRTVHDKSSIKGTTCVHIFSARYVSFLWYLLHSCSSTSELNLMGLYIIVRSWCLFLIMSGTVTTLTCTLVRCGTL